MFTAQKTRITIELWDMMGRKHGDVYHGLMEAGHLKLQHNHQLNPGVYFLRMITESSHALNEKSVLSKRIVIME